MVVAGRTQGGTSKRARGVQDGKERAGPQRRAWLKVVRFTDHSEARSVKIKVCGRRAFSHCSVMPMKSKGSRPGGGSSPLSQVYR